MYLSAAYGLIFLSPFIIREFVPISHGEPDVRISLGKITGAPDKSSSLGALWRNEDDKFLLDVEGVAKFLIVGDSEIVIEIYPDGKEEDTRRFLLGSVLGVILHQRKIVLLRASAVETHKGAFIFLGFSGAGKTSFLYSSLQTGGRMLADEKTPVFLDTDGTVKVSAGYPEMALNADVVHKFNVTVDENRVNREVGKYYYRAAEFDLNPVPLKSIYWLQNHNGEELEIERITSNNAKFNILNSFIYLNPYPFNPLQKINYFRVFTAIAKNTGMTSIKYSLRINQFAEIEKMILEDSVE